MTEHAKEVAAGARFEFRSALIRLVRLQNPFAFKFWSEKSKNRGISVWHNLVDWVGAYPFEVATLKKFLTFSK